MKAAERSAAADDAVARVADFLGRACEAQELDERLEPDGATGATLRLIETMNAFLDKLWLQSFELAANREMLEKVVEIRTNEVQEILDHVDTGFLLTLSDGTILDNFSRSCVDLFGVPDLMGRKLADLMGFDERRKAHFALAYEQVFDDFLPPEVSLDQLPKEFRLGERHYSIHGTPIVGADGRVAKLFFTINDTTELRKLEAENGLRQALIEIVREKESFRAFLHETSGAFACAYRNPSQGKFRTILHTTKGNLGCYGLLDLATLIHTIEDSPEITIQHLESVEDTIKRFLERHQAVIGLEYPERSETPRNAELERMRPLLESLAGEDSRVVRQAAVDAFVRKLTWVRAGGLLAPLRGLVDRVSARIDKEARLELIGQDVLVDPQQTGAVFSNLGHLVRNCLDHGLEPTHERGDKAPIGKISVSCREDDHTWILEVADDGRGIDADAVGAAAVAHGRITAAQLAAMTSDERLRLIFLDGITTREVATIDSGRGVGATALLDSVEAEHGALTIATTPGKGTKVTIRIPIR